MNIAVLVFGQFRSAEEIIENNLEQLKLMFSPLYCTFDIYVLTDKLESGNYSTELESRLKKIITDRGFRIQMFEYWEDFQECYAMEDILKQHMKYISNDYLELGADYATSLSYRRYILWKRFQSISINKTYDFLVFDRMFDIVKKVLRPMLPLLKEKASQETLYFFMDTFFIGTPNIMKQFFLFGSTAENWKSFEWTPEFTREFAEFDCCLADTKPTFCTETQVFQYIRKTFPLWKSIRYDMNAPPDTPNNKEAYLYMKHVRMDVVPKRILQIAIGADYIRELPLEEIKETILKTYNTEYEYTLLTDEGCESFLREFFPEYYGLYRNIQKPQHKSDLVRYLYLYKYGGYYIDIDILPLLPLYTIFEYSNNSPTFFCLSAHTNSRKNTFQVCNGFIGTRPQNPLFLDLAKAIEKQPNPEDYGANVKSLYKILSEKHPMTPFKAVNGIYLFREVQHGGAYFIINSGKGRGSTKFYNREIIAHSNGHDYPPKILSKV